MSELQEYDISGEAWREYELPGGKVYRIDNPVTMFWYRRATTHRILDAEGIVHCVHFAGEFNVVLRWQNKEGLPPVRF